MSKTIKCPNCKAALQITTGTFIGMKWFEASKNLDVSRLDELVKAGSLRVTIRAGEIIQIEQLRARKKR